MRCLIIHLFIHCVYCLASKSYCYNSVSLSRRIKFISLSLFFLSIQQLYLLAPTYFFTQSLYLSSQVLENKQKGYIEKQKESIPWFDTTVLRLYANGEKSAWLHSSSIRPSCNGGIPLVASLSNHELPQQDCHRHQHHPSQLLGLCYDGGNSFPLPWW